MSDRPIAAAQPRRPATIQPPPVPKGLEHTVPPAPSVSVEDKVQQLYHQLSQAATDLNSASDQLLKPIQTWENALKKLNLGVPAWVDISKGNHESAWWSRSIGYTRVKDKWGIALRLRSGDNDAPWEDDEDIWAFSDAPRWLRVESIGKLVDLLEALAKQAEETTRSIKAKTLQANDLAKAIIRAGELGQDPEAK